MSSRRLTVKIIQFVRFRLYSCVCLSWRWLATCPRRVTNAQARVNSPCLFRGWEDTWGQVLTPSTTSGFRWWLSTVRTQKTTKDPQQLLRKSGRNFPGTLVSPLVNRYSRACHMEREKEAVGFGESCLAPWTEKCHSVITWVNIKPGKIEAKCFLSATPNCPQI